MDWLSHKNERRRDKRIGAFLALFACIFLLKELTYNTHIAIIHIMIEYKANQKLIQTKGVVMSTADKNTAVSEILEQLKALLLTDDCL